MDQLEEPPIVPTAHANEAISALAVFIDQPDRELDRAAVRKTMDEVEKRIEVDRAEDNRLLAKWKAIFESECRHVEAWNFFDERYDQFVTQAYAAEELHGTNLGGLGSPINPEYVDASSRERRSKDVLDLSQLYDEVISRPDYEGHEWVEVLRECREEYKSHPVLGPAAKAYADALEARYEPVWDNIDEWYRKRKAADQNA